MKDMPAARELAIPIPHERIADYTRVNFDLVWDAATQEVPTLIENLSKFVPSDPP